MANLKRLLADSNRPIRLAVGLLFFLVVVLFPYGWLADLWPAFAHFTNFLFGSEIAHVVGHSALFAVLALLLLFAFPRLGNHYVLFVALIAFVGALQEWLQLVSFKQRAAGPADVKDLVVDLLAATAVFVVMHYLKAARPFLPHPLERKESYDNV